MKDVPLSRPYRATWWRTLWAAMVLGWEEQFNWIRDPLLLAIYLLIRPLATVALIVVMYGLVTQGAWQDPLFAYIYLGNALYIYVGYVFQATAWTIIDEREHYRTLKYLAITPSPLVWFLLGRAIVPLMLGTTSVVVALLAGVVFFRLPLDWDTLSWGRLLVGLLVGWSGLMAIGFFLAGVTLNARRYMWVIGEAVAGTLYVCTGAIFPLTVLPRPLQALGYALPITYWLEYMRRVLLRPGWTTAPPWDAWPTSTLFTVLTLVTLAYLVVALVVFRYAEYRARHMDLLEATSDY